MPILFLALLTAAPVFANEDGITGFARLGCTDCHGKLPSSAVSVELSAPTGMVTGSETVTLQLRITSTDPAHVAAGLDVEASDGALIPAPTMLLRKYELTHQYPHAMDEGAIVFDFDWTAPAYAGEVTLWAAGNAVNQDGWATDDGWSRDWLSLMVDSDCSDADGDNVGDCEDDCDDLDATVYPGAVDTWYDGVDSDCAGNDDHDQDGDGFPVDADCDDTDPNRSAAEDCTSDDADSGAGDSGSSGDDGGADSGPAPAPAKGCQAFGTAAGLLWLPLLLIIRRRAEASPSPSP